MQRGFTLLEICIAIFIAMLVVSMAVPSITAVLQGREEEARFEALNELVQAGRLRSIEQRQPWAIEFQPEALLLRPLLPATEPEEEEERLEIAEEESFAVKFPTALVEQPPGLWVFWPSGNCEAAIVSYTGEGTRWEAHYHPLTGQAEVIYPEKK